MFNCDEKEIIKFDADFNEDFDNLMLEIIGKVPRLYFLDSKGFGLKSRPSNSKFNKSVDLLPSTLTHIKFGYSFDKEVNNLPYHLEWLEFGNNFNQYVDNLPSTIKYLVFGNEFNCPVDNLPQFIEYLSFGNKFNYPIDCLPNSINFINIGDNKNTNIKSKFSQKTNNLPSELNNFVIYLSNGKNVIKFDFVNKLNQLVCQVNK